MSAFIVSTSTIEAIVTFVVRHLDSIEPLPGTSTANWVSIRAECPDAIGQDELGRRLLEAIICDPDVPEHLKQNAVRLLNEPGGTPSRGAPSSDDAPD